ncbi:unnamed protein product, partial [Tenebrio molitor]
VPPTLRHSQLGQRQRRCRKSRADGLKGIECHFDIYDNRHCAPFDLTLSLGLFSESSRPNPIWKFF